MTTPALTSMVMITEIGQITANTIEQDVIPPETRQIKVRIAIDEIWKTWLALLRFPVFLKRKQFAKKSPATNNVTISVMSNTPNIKMENRGMIRLEAKDSKPKRRRNLAFLRKITSSIFDRETWGRK